MANNINFGKIYETTWFGNPVQNGWGGIYYDLSNALNEITTIYNDRVLADGGTIENLSCVNTITNTFTPNPPDERFIISVKTNNAGTSATNQFTLPTLGTGYNYDIVTSDGQTILANTGNTTITFPTAGTYTIFISGSFPQCYFNNAGDLEKLLDIKNFGIYGIGSTSQNQAFRGCSNMVISASDTGHFENVTNFSNSWRDCSSLTSFPLIDTSSGGFFINCWRGCSSLTSFPSNAFDTNTSANYLNAFTATDLTTQSIDNILVSLDTSGVSNGTFTQSDGQPPSSTGQTAITNLVNKGWTITTT